MSLRVPPLSQLRTQNIFNLPRLPIPKLQDTRARYEKSCRALSPICTASCSSPLVRLFAPGSFSSSSSSSSSSSCTTTAAASSDTAGEATTTSPSSTSENNNSSSSSSSPSLSSAATACASSSSPSLEQLQSQFQDLLSSHLATFDKFVSTSGPKIQQELESRDQEAAAKSGEYPFSYIEPIWDDGYLEYDDPCPINVAPGYTSKPLDPTWSQARVAAKLARACSKWFLAASDGTLPMEQKPGRAVCLAGLPVQMGFYRKPGALRDGLHVARSTQLAVRYVTVLCKGNVFLVSLVNQKGKLRSSRSLTKAFDTILAKTEGQAFSEFPLPALTTANRRDWFKTRSVLKDTTTKEGHNLTNLRHIEDSLIVICLDSSYPNLQQGDQSLMCTNNLVGVGQNKFNRWWDKHQLIVTETSGRDGFGFIAEHAFSDAMAWSKWTDLVHADIISGGKVLPSPKDLIVSAEELLVVPPSPPSAEACPPAKNPMKDLKKEDDAENNNKTSSNHDEEKEREELEAKRKKNEEEAEALKQHEAAATPSSESAAALQKQVKDFLKKQREQEAAASDDQQEEEDKKTQKGEEKEQVLGNSQQQEAATTTSSSSSSSSSSSDVEKQQQNNQEVDKAKSNQQNSTAAEEEEEEEEGTATDEDDALLEKPITKHDVKKEPSLRESPLGKVEGNGAILLDFKISDTTKTSITLQVANHNEVCNNLRQIAVQLPFGKSDCKSRFKVGPDALCQASYHLAFARLHKYISPTYESCATEKFFHGRTETIRSATREMNLFVQQAFDFNNNSNGGSDKKEALAKLLRNAADSHRNIAIEAQNGQGLDRHLLALKCLVSEESDPEGLAFFSEPLYGHSGTWSLSTSNVSVPSLSWFQFGPVVPSGYGIGYCVHDSQVNVGLSSYRDSSETDAGEMAALMMQAAKDIRDILDTK